MEIRPTDWFFGALRAFSLGRHRKVYYSQFGEDCVILQRTRDAPPGYYVDVGAFHPVKHSNTYALYRAGWRGVVIDIEPSKIAAFRLRRPRDIGVLCAIADRPGQAEVFAKKSFSVMTTTSPEIARERSLPKIGEIEQSTLTDILDSTAFKDQPIDVLSIDVEGVDELVLSGLDFDRYRPRMIIVESYVSTIDELLDSNLNALMNERGYVVKNWVGLSVFYGPRVE
jgi:FkbM family methyltransferase